MWTNALLWALFALSASAQNKGLPISGPNKPGIGITPEALQISAAAGRQPNATTSVTFTRTYNNTPENWAWRINITEIAVPNRIYDLGMPSANFSQGLHVANTQWQLEWPSDDNSLQSLLEQRNMSVSFTTLISNKPSNITDRYNEVDNGNCVPILGDQCTQSLTQSASKGSTFSLSNLEGCDNTLAINDGGQGDGPGFGKTTLMLYDSTLSDQAYVAVVINPVDPNSNSSDTPMLNRTGTLFYRTSVTYTAGNLTQLHQSESALQVFIMNFENKGGELGDTSGATVLCRVVDKAADSAAVSWRQSKAALWGVVLLSTLTIMWQG